MNKTHLVGIHKAGIAHHVATIGEVDGQHRSAAMLDGAGAVVVQGFIIVGADIAAREDFFEMLEKIGIHGHHVLKVAMLGAILHHEDLAVALDDLGLDLAGLFVQQNFVRQLAIDDLLADFRDALRAQRICAAGPSERGLRLLIRLEQRLV